MIGPIRMFKAAPRTNSGRKSSTFEATVNVGNPPESRSNPGGQWVLALFTALSGDLEGCVVYGGVFQ